MADGFITVPSLADGRGSVRHFFGTRGHPRSLSALFQPAPRAVVAVKQVHGTDALVLDRPIPAGSAFAGGWDSLVTNQPGVLLTVRTADCVPVLIHDPVRRVVAAVHAGWRGAVAGIVRRTIGVMRRRFGSEPRDLSVGIGPSVGSCCYEVDEPVLQPLRADFPDWREVVRETGPGKARLDLRELIRRQARALGVDGGHVSLVNVCTVCHPDLFHSYRREGRANETMVSGIMLTRPQKGRRRKDEG